MLAEVVLDESKVPSRLSTLPYHPVYTCHGLTRTTVLQRHSKSLLRDKFRRRVGCSIISRRKANVKRTLTPTSTSPSSRDIDSQPRFLFKKGDTWRQSSIYTHAEMERHAYSTAASVILTNFTRATFAISERKFLPIV